MFNIGPPELIVLLLVALLIVGPKRLPEVGKTIGRSLREFRKAQDDLKSSFNFDVEDEAPAKTPPKSRAKEPHIPNAKRDDEATLDGSADDPAAVEDSSDPPADSADGD